MTPKAGETDTTHSHSNGVVRFITGGKVSIALENGEKMEADLPHGFVLPHEPWMHTVSNVGTTDIRAIIFETNKRYSEAVAGELRRAARTSLPPAMARGNSRSALSASLTSRPPTIRR
jgi:hypothetical protein